MLRLESIFTIWGLLDQLNECNGINFEIKIQQELKDFWAKPLKFMTPKYRQKSMQIN
jgi:hypothetical protein